MKPNSLPASIQTQLSTVANIADRLAGTFACTSSLSMPELSACLDNLDDVAASLKIEELSDAPSRLNAVARAFRATFPGDSIGWEDAGTLQRIASDLSAFLGPWEARAWQAMSPAAREAQKQAHINARNLRGSNGHPGTSIT